MKPSINPTPVKKKKTLYIFAPWVQILKDFSTKVHIIYYLTVSFIISQRPLQ